MSRHRSKHHHDHAELAKGIVPPDGWPTAEDIAAVYDVAAAHTAAIEHLHANLMLDLLKSLPVGVRGEVLRAIQLPRANKVNRGMATALVNQLRRTSPGSEAVESIVRPLHIAFFHVDLTGDQWRTLLSGDQSTIRGLYQDQDLLMRTLTAAASYLEDEFLILGLLDAVNTSPVAAAALSFLAYAEPDAAAAHAELSALFPDLPPISSRWLRDVCPEALMDDKLAQPQETEIGIATGHAAINAHQDAAVSAAAENSSPGPADVDGTVEPVPTSADLDALVRLEGKLDWKRAANLANEFAELLDDARAPEVDDVTELHEFTTEAQRLARRLSHLTRSAVPASADALDASLEALRRSHLNHSKIAALTTCSGPATLAAVLAVIRNLAVAALADLGEHDLGEHADALAALHDLAMLGQARKNGEDIDFVVMADLEAIIRAGLPAEAYPATMAAVAGDLTLALQPNDPEGSQPDPDATEALPDEHVDERRSGSAVAPKRATPSALRIEASAVEDAAHPDAASGVDDDGATAAAADPIQPEASHTDQLGRAPNDAHPSLATSERDTAGEPVAEPPVVEAGDIDLSQLDELLAAGAAPDLVRRMPAKSPSAHDSRTDAPNDTTRSPEPREPSSPADDDLDEQLAAAEVRALAQARYGLASLLHADRSQVAARRIAAYQAHLTSATGGLAAAFSQETIHVHRGDLGHDRPGHLLAWAAAARVAIVAPASGAAAILQDLAPCVAAYPALTRIGSELAAASRAGAIALPDVADQVSAQHSADSRAAGLAQQARSLLEDATQRTVKYAPANGVYQAWMSGGGVLGPLLSTVAGNDPNYAANVREQVIGLLPVVDRSIDDTFHDQRRRNGRAKIVAGARNTLTQRYQEALDLCGQWADAATTSVELRDRDRGRGNARSARPIEKLRRGIEGVREEGLAELDSIREQAPDTPDGRLEAAAAAACLVMLTDTFATCDGRPPRGPEPTPGWVLHCDLVGTDVELAADTLEPRASIAEVTQLAQLLAAGPPISDEDAYGHRAERGEHDITAAHVANLEAVNPVAGQLLRTRREADVAERRANLADQLDQLSADIDQRRQVATLPEDVWSALSADIEALRAPARRDFGRIEHEVARINDTVDKCGLELVHETRGRIEEKAAENQAVAANKDTLLGFVDAGDVAGAEEYLEVLTAGGTLPDFRGVGDHLRRFFPAVPDLAARHADLLPDLRSALETGKLTTPVAALVDAAGVTLTDNIETSRHSATRALGAWGKLASSPNQRDIDAPGALRWVLETCGLEFATAEVQTRRNQAQRQWVQLKGVTGVGYALSPSLGSQMSPSGATLRVMLTWKKVPPATLIEWVRDGQQDTTVVVLTLGGSYSAAERRALANAARGQSRPVVIVIDPAALSYLAVQPEALRSTLAQITLPFTADSPYRDMAGDTAPEMFYGRTMERDAVMDLNGPSFVSGGRQLGKSALLRDAARKFNNGDTRRAVFREIRVVGADNDPEQLWPMLQASLHDADITPAPIGHVTAESVGALILEWLEDDLERSLLILIDEADNFLTADADGNKFTQVSACKRLMDEAERRVKFVFAGLHRTARFESLANQPLAHLGRPIVVGPLRPQAAHDLLTRPLAALGYTFNDPVRQPARILAVTNNVPSLLQLFGRALITHLTSREVVQGPPEVISDTDIDAVLDDTDLREGFREKYILTLNLDHRYLVIVYVVALAAHEQGVDEGLTVNQLAEQCRSFWPAGFATLGIDHLRGLVTECCDVGLLALNQGRYRMRTPTVLRLLGNAEAVVDVLTTAEERLKLPSPLTAQSHRQLLHKSGHRSPLTARQIAQIFSRRPQTLLVVGTEALGISWVATCLEQVQHDGRSGGADVRRLSNPTPAGLLTLAGRVTKPTVLIADVRTKGPAHVGALVDAVDATHDAAHCPLTVVIVADTRSAPRWAGSGDVLELTRVDAAGLSLWIDEENAPYHTPEDQADLLQLTGGWLHLVERAMAATGGAVVARGRGNIDDLRGQLVSEGGAAELLTSAGVGRGDSQPVTVALRAALDIVADLTRDGGAPMEVLTELLDDADTDGRLDRLALAAGFAKTDDALLVLRAIGLLDVDTVGNLTVEPTLNAANATLTSGQAGP
ncbi:hypothetical protein [Nocardioides speluncae]|uniref:hypothetical protein n=1 Tax=Nocardioides speluncae TaxID=2670337 RepID=UPI0012B16238|nr:hypothetical protein [Nocardioides speluncae]